LISNNLTNIENKEKDLGEANYFYKDLYYNFKSALGKNWFLWLFPYGEGYEEGQKYYGYQFYVNQNKLGEYSEIKKQRKQKSELERQIKLASNLSNASELNTHFNSNNSNLKGFRTRPSTTQSIGAFKSFKERENKRFDYKSEISNNNTNTNNNLKEKLLVQEK
jgi:hypothetical protein